MADHATNCTLDIETKLKALKGEPFADKVIQVISQDDFESKIRLLTTPFAGIMYSGLRGDVPDSPRQGMSGRLVVVVIYGFASVSAHDHKKDAWEHLSLARNAIRMTKSPTGHVWRFVQEMYFDVIGGVAFYTQSWDTVAILTTSQG